MLSKKILRLACSDWNLSELLNIHLFASDCFVILCWIPLFTEDRAKVEELNVLYLDLVSHLEKMDLGL